MKSLVLALALTLSVSTSQAGAEEMITVTPAGTTATTTGSPANFTGTVLIDGLFRAPAPARIGGGTVTFSPGARTAWHTHPLGQTLFVTAGVGLVQSRGGPIREIRPGDVVWIPPGVEHWHGATAGNGMSHIAIAESLDGKSVEWMEPVSDEQYRR